jgi:EAL and modified HD-GYP domain-containing signal transduction protein
MVRGLHRVLPPEGIIFELRDEPPYDGATLDALRRARREGYHFALDNVHSPSQVEESPLFPLCSLVKVDFKATPLETVATIVSRVKDARSDVLVAGEKVESAEQYSVAVDSGVELFQGYYFARPDLLRKSARPTSSMAVMALLAETQRPDISIDHLEQVVGGDPSLAYRVLAVVNSSAFGLDRRVESLRHAIVLLGINHVRHLAVLLAMSTTRDGNEELIRLGATRARLLSRIASQPADASAAFLVGLLSVTDAIYRTPISELIDELPVSASIAAALVDGEGTLGTLLAVARACEQADTDRVEQLMPGAAAPIWEEYRRAVEWSDSICETFGSLPSGQFHRLRSLISH